MSSIEDVHKISTIIGDNHTEKKVEPTLEQYKDTPLFRVAWPENVIAFIHIDEEKVLEIYNTFAEPYQSKVKLSWERAKGAANALADAVDKNLRNLKPLNDQVTDFQQANDKYEADRATKSQEVEAQIAKYEPEKKTLRKKSANLKQEKSLITAKLAYQTNEKNRKLAFTNAKNIHPSAVYIEWIARCILGAVFGMSLGLLVGALNIYRIFSPQLIAFWITGVAVLTLSGEVMKWLAEQAADETYSRNYRKTTGIWALGIYTFGISVAWIDSTTVMYGVFRALSVTVFASTQNTLPMWIIFIVCFVFIYPYILFETSLGYAHVKSQKRAIEGEVAAENDDKDEQGEYKPESALDLVEKDALLSAQIAEVERELSEIANKEQTLRATVPQRRYYPPVADFTQGVVCEDEPKVTIPNKGIIEILTLYKIPVTEELILAEANYQSALKELRHFEDEAFTNMLPKPRQSFWHRRFST